jgi:two-component system, LuxR family, response regulator FixJ
MYNPTGPVILVDDNAAVRKSLKFSMESEGLTVEVYQSGAELLARSGPPQNACLVIDYVMPEMDGIELLRRLRERHVTAPAIMITPQATAELRERAARTGFSGVIEKPLEGTSFYDSIRAALDASRDLLIRLGRS